MLRGASTILMVVAVLAVVGFMWWLDRKAGSLDSQVAPVLEETVQNVDLDGAALAADPAAAVGETGYLRSVAVAQRLGRGTFTLQLDGIQYPVLLSSDLIQMDTQVYGGDMVTVYGHVFTLNDSIRSVWVDQEAVDSEYASAIPASPSFIMADSLSFN
ncbi:MAG: hypothetical protein Q8W45_05680 [Candidatus Palauibacterales bacterium]|jgi:hypothetical protein|nr:hypothetical protein [Candidatus Palauibacterales bacterium]MDP2482749.1 hypothetical protein [Candidatus Palauibacterales bacterium]